MFVLRGKCGNYRVTKKGNIGLYRATNEGMDLS